MDMSCEVTEMVRLFPVTDFGSCFSPSLCVIWDGFATGHVFTNAAWYIWSKATRSAEKACLASHAFLSKSAVVWSESRNTVFRTARISCGDMLLFRHI